MELARGLRDPVADVRPVLSRSRKKLTAARGSSTGSERRRSPESEGAVRVGLQGFGECLVGHALPVLVEQLEMLAEDGQPAAPFAFWSHGDTPTGPVKPNLSKAI
jgi:hypothetical protein